MSVLDDGPNENFVNKLNNNSDDQNNKNNQIQQTKSVENNHGSTVKTPYDNTYDTNNMNEIFDKPEQFYGILKKYWNQRFNLFSKYDEGILLTKELWFSVTPEVISKFTASIIKLGFKDKNEPIFVMDAFAGGGGNINMFLEYFDTVFAADINHIHLYCTENNAKVYFPANEVNSKLKLLPLNWVYADDELDSNYIDEEFENNAEDETDECVKKGLIERVYANKVESLESLEILKDMRLDCIFGSPPWGGPEYMREKYFNLDNVGPYPLEKLLTILLRYTDNVCLFLPKNSNLLQLQHITNNIFHDERYIRVLKTSIMGRPKGLLCCWGPAFRDLDLEDITI